MRTPGTSFVESTTVMRKSKKASSSSSPSSSPSSSAKSTDTFQVTCWPGSEHIGSESLSSRRSLHHVEGSNLDLHEAALHGRGVREHLERGPEGGRSQVRGEGHRDGQHWAETRLFTCERTGSGLNQLQITSHSSVTSQAASTEITGQVPKFSTQKSKHSPFSMIDLLKFFESGPRIQAHVINGVARWVTYGGTHMMTLGKLTYETQGVCTADSFLLGSRLSWAWWRKFHKVLFCGTVQSAATKL